MVYNNPRLTAAEILAVHEDRRRYLLLCFELATLKLRELVGGD